MSEILPGLFLGGIASCTSDFLISNHIQALVSCCNEFDFGDPPIPIAQFRVPVEDISNEPIIDYISDACLFISKHLEMGGVLVHCRSGVSRSATVIIGYLMKVLHLTLNDAFMLVISRRSCICPNIGFMKQLCLLEETLVREGEDDVSQFPFSDGSVQDSRISDPPLPISNPIVTTSSTCGCCLSEPSSPSPASERMPREAAADQFLDPRRSNTWSTTTSAAVSGTGKVQSQQAESKDIERLRSLGQALMASQYSSSFPAYGAASRASSDSSSESGTPQRKESALDQSHSQALSLDHSPMGPFQRHQTTESPVAPSLHVHSASTTSPHDRPYPQPISLSSGPSPRATFLTPRNAMSCVNSPDNVFHSLAVKSPSLSMSKYISWYTMSGERARAPSLAP